jgi:hypothetical protein
MNKCRFCGREVVANASGDTDPVWDSRLSSMVACNRCADYRAGKRKWGEAIARVCSELSVVKRGRRGLPQEARQEAEAALRRLTQSYSATICRYLGLPDDWGEDYVDQLIESPRNVWYILKAFEDGAHYAARAKQPELPPYSNDP